MPLLMNNELARRENGKVQLRPSPVRVRWNLDDLVTGDGHKLHCGFTCSVTALPEPSERRKVEEMERTLAERRVAGQVEHFERASRLLKQFQELRAAAPELSPAEVLKQISPADRGLMLQTLLLAAGKSGATASLWAVAGGSL